MFITDEWRLGFRFSLSHDLIEQVQEFGIDYYTICSKIKIKDRIRTTYYNLKIFLWRKLLFISSPTSVKKYCLALKAET